MIYNLLSWIKGFFGQSARMPQVPVDNWDLLPYSFEIDWYVRVRKNTYMTKVTEDPPANYGGTE